MSILKRAEAFAQTHAYVPYVYENGPVSEAVDSWFIEGLNCQLLLHIAVQEFFMVTLPKELRSSEIFADTEWFEEIFPSQMQDGDVLLMGPRSLQPKKDPLNEDAKRLHLALVTEVSKQSISVLHARPHKGIILEPLTEIVQIQRGTSKPYEQIFAIKRLKEIGSWPQ